MSDESNGTSPLDRRHMLGALAAGVSAFTFLGGASKANAANVHKGETMADFRSKAMGKVFWLIQKNPAISTEEFQEAYLHHAKEIAEQIAANDSVVYYRLTFPDRQYLSMQQIPPGEVKSYTGPQVRLEWDCVTEMGFAQYDGLQSVLHEHEGTAAEYESQLHEMEFINYSTIVSIHGKEYVFAD